LRPAPANSLRDHDHPKITRAERTVILAQTVECPLKCEFLSSNPVLLPKKMEVEEMIKYDVSHNYVIDRMLSLPPETHASYSEGSDDSKFTQTLLEIEENL
jgi:hypothetical protein